MSAWIRPIRPVSIVGLVAGLMVGPAAWIVQLVVCYGLTAQLCHGPNLPRPSVLLAVNAACLLAAIVGAALSFAALRRVASRRDRFLAGCAVMSDLGFALAILFNTPEVFAGPACLGQGA